MASWRKDKPPPLCTVCGTPCKVFQPRKADGTLYKCYHANTTCSPECRVKSRHASKPADIRRKIGDGVKAFYAANPDKAAEQGTKAQAAFKRKRDTGWVPRRSEAQKARMCVTAKRVYAGQLNTPAAQQAAYERRKETLYPMLLSSPAVGGSAIGPDNHAAGQYVLTSPSGVRYDVINLTQFVRDNAGLFDGVHFDWQYNAKNGSTAEGKASCTQLKQLYAVASGRCATFHGWRVHNTGRRPNAKQPVVDQVSAA